MSPLNRSMHRYPRRGNSLVRVQRRALVIAFVLAAALAVLAYVTHEPGETDEEWAARMLLENALGREEVIR